MKLVQVDDRFAALIVKHVFSGFSVNNDAHPTGLCVTCRLALVALEKVFFNLIIVSLYLNIQNPSNPGRKLPPPLDYQNMVPNLPNTRSSAGSPCACTVCTIARMQNQEYVAYVKHQTGVIGRPRSRPPSPVPKAIKVCDKCLSEMAPGLAHHCQKITRRENVITLLRNSSINSEQNILATGLKHIAEDGGVSSRGGTIELKSGSNLLPIKVGSEKCKPKSSRFSHEDLKSLRIKLNLSNTAIM